MRCRLFCLVQPLCEGTFATLANEQLACTHKMCVCDGCSFVVLVARMFDCIRESKSVVKRGVVDLCTMNLRASVYAAAMAFQCGTCASLGDNQVCSKQRDVDGAAAVCIPGVALVLTLYSCRSSRPQICCRVKSKAMSVCAIVERASNEVSLSTGQPVDHGPEPKGAGPPKHPDSQLQRKGGEAVSKDSRMTLKTLFNAHYACVVGAVFAVTVPYCNQTRQAQMPKKSSNLLSEVVFRHMFNVSMVQACSLEPRGAICQVTQASGTPPKMT
jgi:hypothetical protein